VTATLATRCRHRARSQKHASAPRRFCSRSNRPSFTPFPVRTLGEHASQAVGRSGRSIILNVDPAVATTGAPYTYANDDPVNEDDPLGLWGWNPISDVTQAAGDAGHFVAQHKKGILIGAGVALGVAAAATGVGAVVEVGIAAGAEGAAATAALSTSSLLGGVSLAAGAGATALDANSCVGGHEAVACVGLALGGTALLASGAGEIGTIGLLNGWITAETLPDAALFGVSGFGALFGIGGSIFDSIYGINQLLQGEGSCGS
jgi:hypothetical protein